MMLPDSERDIKHKPWTFSQNTLPVETRSFRTLQKCGRGRPLRARAQRKKHKMTYEDALRFLSRFSVPEDEYAATWIEKFIAALRAATLEILGKLLPMLSEGVIESLYDFIIGLMDKFLDKIGFGADEQLRQARRLIRYLADRVGLSVEIKG